MEQNQQTSGIKENKEKAKTLGDKFRAKRDARIQQAKENPKGRKKKWA